MLPQTAAREKDLDYSNMAACFPRNGGDTSHGYGAPVKAGAIINHNVNFVSPHNLGCEQRFRYDNKGEVQAAEGDAAAEQTIQILKLNHRALVDLRRRAIETEGLSLRPGTGRKRIPPISATQARRLARTILESDANGRLSAFCIAIHQVAL